MKTCFIVGSKYTEFPFDYEKETRYREDLQQTNRKIAQKLINEQGCKRFIFLDVKGANLDFLAELFLLKKEKNIVIELFTFSKKENYYFDFADKIHFISYKFPFFKNKRLNKYILSLSDYIYIFYGKHSKKSQAYKTLLLSEKMNIDGDLYLLEELTDSHKLLRQEINNLIKNQLDFLKK